MAYIRSVSTAFPRAYSQLDLKKNFIEFCQHLGAGPKFSAKASSMFHNAQISSRGFLFPPFQHSPNTKLENKMKEWTTKMADFSAGNVRAAVAKAGYKLGNIHEIITTSNIPDLPPIGMKVVENLGLSRFTTITNHEALGCVGGVSTIHSAFKTLKHETNKVVVANTIDCASLYWNGSFTHALKDVLPNSEHLFNDEGSVYEVTKVKNGNAVYSYKFKELASDDELRREQILNITAIASLVGDGASSVVLVGENHPDILQQEQLREMGMQYRKYIKIIDGISYFVPGTMGLVSQTVGENGFSLLMSKHLSQVIPKAAKDLTEQILDKCKLRREDLKFFLMHPGGKNILNGFKEKLNIPESELARSWTAMSDVGNAVGSTVVKILEDFERGHKLPAGSKGLMIAVGPGLKFEALVLEV